MIDKFYKSFINVALFGMLILGIPGLSNADLSARSSDSQSQCELVILANPDDPYHPLAEEIATAENAPIAHSLMEALSCQPVFLLWVVSPGFLSDEVMIEFGLIMKDQSSAVSSGIITGSTIEQARDLWERRTQVRGENLYAVNAPNPAAHIYEGQVMNFEQEQVTRQPLTMSNFEMALQSADYLTFTGHGGSKYLRINEDTKITSSDIPALDSIVIGTGSCQTFRPWNEDSIARTFADQGAAAYTGFVFSPNEGYLLGEFDGLPFRYTWQDFPIGHVVQAQNRGTLQGFAYLPYQHILGDPRIALQDAPPYQLVEDRQEGDQRVITYQDVPAGVIPIRIDEGAKYQFVQAVGITSAAEGDLFYNSRLQMVNIQEDKFILLVHDGGELTLRLRPQAPWYWFIGDLLSDSLDHTLVFSQQSSGDILALLFLIVPLVWVGWQVFKKRLAGKKVYKAIVVGLCATLLHGVYVLTRLDNITITTKTVVFSPLSMLAVFMVTTCGAIIYFQSRTWLGKVMGLIVATIVYWSPIAFGLPVIAGSNLLFFIPETGSAIYNYSLGLLPISAFLFTFILYGLIFWFFDSMETRTTQMSAATKNVKSHP